MRYLVQRNEFSCGPIAIINTLKWCGARATYSSHYKKLVKDCKTDIHGTSDSAFSYQLKRYTRGLVSEIVTDVGPELNNIMSHLENGGLVLLAHELPRYGHFVCLTYNAEAILAINDHKGNTKKISKRTLKSWLKFKDINYCFYVSKKV